MTQHLHQTLVNPVTLLPGDAKRWLLWWSKTTKIGVSKWRWDESMTSGGILGPLPSYGFCAVLKRGDTRGITGYEFADGGVGVPDSNGIPTYGPDANGIQNYKTAVPMTATAFDLGSEFNLFSCCDL